jgi:hypothetical protein
MRKLANKAYTSTVDGSDLDRFHSCSVYVRLCRTNMSKDRIVFAFS